MPAGELILSVFAGVAQFECERIKKRQRKGMMRPAKGVYKGGTRHFSTDDIRRMHADGMGATEIMRAIGAKSTTTVYRALNGGE